ncbi:ShlB/FhaC/HecB family hemolysin secretion/activation protein [Marinobacter sp. M216]|uniref:ShlB/FhaC/HecB family hemolysin secretion/activation protein n=1 Tax=Marinobacter albus TaxID=3030833 RepID=A0ABT7HBA2_9GAMM|nr:ShlB/FhaC/HecB family hemolysin secretion/activation protein [Marinobacter sp. M216]MDK9557648.1 ShlB/FhaC/HecB family hemolysin secretion/activation protein [Marinobacter sp. M216]
MRVTRFFALILCISLINIGAASGYEGASGPAGGYPGELLPSVARYVASKVQVTGSSNHDDERTYGRVGLASDDLGWSKQRIGLNYQDTVSRRENLESSSLVFNYGLSVSNFDIGMEFENSDWTGVSVGEGNRFDSQSEHDVFRIKGSRPLVSWRGFSLNSLLNHASGTSSMANATGWAEETQYQISKLGLEVREDHELLAGLRSSTSLRAFGGVETRDVTNTSSHNYTEDQFRKIALSASIHRDIHDWSLGLGGQYQFAGKDLPSAEQIQIAGSSLAMGYSGQAKYAAEGGWLRLEAGSPKFRIPVFPGTQSSVQMAMLRGWTPGNEPDGLQEGGASVGEVSLKLDSRDFYAALSVGKMLAVSDPELTLPSHPDLSFSIFVDM